MTDSAGGSGHVDSDKHSHGPKVLLPKTLEHLPKAKELVRVRHRWNTNEEIATWLISCDKHEEWLDKTLKTRPESGSLLMYNRKKVSYRRDGYVWKKRKDGKSTRLDHMKLKIDGVECLYAYYAHSALMPTFHRRCYWLLQNPDIILVHYLNSLCQEDPKSGEIGTISPNIPLVYNPNLSEGKAWTREDFREQIKPMFGCHMRLDKHTVISSDDSVEAIVQFMLEEQDKLVRSKGVETTTDMKILKPKEEKPSTSGGIMSPVMLSPSPVIKVEDKFGACPTHTTKGQMMPLVIVVSNVSGCSATAGAPVFTVAKTGGMRSITPLASVLKNAVPGVQGQVVVSSAAVYQNCQFQPSPIGSSSSSSEEVTIISPPPSDSPQGPISLDSSPQSNAATAGSSTSTSSAGQGASKTEPLVMGLSTPKSSAALQRIVESNPNLMTIQYRFQNQNIVEVDPKTQNPLDKYIRNQLDKRKEIQMDSQSAMTSSTDVVVSQTCTDNLMEAVTTPPLTTTSRSSPGILTMATGYPPNLSSQTTTPQHQPHPANINEIHPAQINMVGNFPPGQVNTQQVNVPPFGNVPQNLRFNFNPGPARTSQTTLNTPYAPHQLSQDIGSIPSPSDIDLDFDTDIFDGSLAGINPSSLNDPALEQTNTVQSHSLSGSTGSNFNQGQSLPNVRPGDGGTPLSAFSTAPVGRLQDNALASVTEFSPDWSYPEGGVKILVTGPWQNSNANYQCLFDSFAVPASLIQTGVLRCYCPAHEAALVTLEVSCNNTVVSKSVVFEYKARSASQQRPSAQHEWLSLEENQFRMSLLERLEQMERRLGTSNVPPQTRQPQGPGGGNRHLTFEDRIVSICERLMQSAASVSTTQQSNNMRIDQAARGMTLLHLAAALGYFKLIDLLVRWKNERHGLMLEFEVDAMNVDHFSCTPLMWACALGHKETALLLYHWFPAALHVCDSHGRLPVDVAKSRGHTMLADCLERLEFEGQRSQNPSSPSSISQPIAIPQPNRTNKLPAFMVSSPATPTPESSSTSAISPLVFDSPSPSSGCLSQLSTSPSTSQGFLSPNAMQSHSPRVAGGSAGSASVTNASTNTRRDPFHMDLAQGGIFSELDMAVLDSHVSEMLSGRRPHPSSASSSSGQPTLHPSAATGPRHNQPTNQELSSQQLLCGINTGNFLRGAGTTSSSAGSGHDPRGSTSSSDHGHNQDSRCDSPMQVDAIMEGVMEGQFDIGNHNKEQYLTLAEQILDALPARIKEINFADFPIPENDIPTASSSSLDGSGPNDMYSYRNPYEVSSPASTYSTDSCLPSPSNLSFEDDSSTADWCEFLQGGNYNSSFNRRVMGAFSLLKLNDGEQRQLYKAALVIQHAFRQYRGRQQQKQSELEAAVIIQSYYRRYKEYVMFKEMTDAARVIQSRFRTLKSYRHFQRSRNAAIIIQSRYRTYRAQEQYRKSRDAAILIQQRFRDKRLARLKRQQDAARKIQRFIRRYTNRGRNKQQQK